MIEFASKDFKDAKLGNKQIIKICQGVDLKWERRVVKTITFNTQEEIQQSSDLIPVPSNIIKDLQNKEIISLKIGNYQPLTYGLSAKSNGISLPGSLRQELTLFNPIKKGTEITIKYK